MLKTHPPSRCAFLLRCVFLLLTTLVGSSKYIFEVREHAGSIEEDTTDWILTSSTASLPPTTCPSFRAARFICQHSSPSASYSNLIPAASAVVHSDLSYIERARDRAAVRSVLIRNTDPVTMTYFCESACMKAHHPCQSKLPSEIHSSRTRYDVIDCKRSCLGQCTEPADAPIGRTNVLHARSRVSRLECIEGLFNPQYNGKTWEPRLFEACRNLQLICTILYEITKIVVLSRYYWNNRTTRKSLRNTQCYTGRNSPLSKDHKRPCPRRYSRNGARYYMGRAWLSYPLRKRYESRFVPIIQDPSRTFVGGDNPSDADWITISRSRKRRASAPLYHEPQYNNLCAMHTTNSMLRSPTYDPCSYYATALVTRALKVPKNKVDPALMQYTIHTFRRILSNATLNHGEFANIPQSTQWHLVSSHDRATTLSDLCSTLTTSHTVGYVSTPGHIAAIHYIDEQWWLVDSERRGPTPAGSVHLHELRVGETPTTSYQIDFFTHAEGNPRVSRPIFSTRDPIVATSLPIEVQRIIPMVHIERHVNHPNHSVTYIWGTSPPHPEPCVTTLRKLLCRLLDVHMQDYSDVERNEQGRLDGDHIWQVKWPHMR